jgi:UDP-3-O-[3-hydroxymyristoyl] glucosamine N-acyltransferase
VLTGPKLSELAERLEVELRGDGDMRVAKVATLQQAGPGDLSFLANARYRRHLPATRASAVVLAEADAAACPVAALVTEHPYLCYARAARLLHPVAPVEAGIHPSAVVDPRARLDPSACIDELSVIEADADIGPRVEVGARCFIGAGVRVGADTRLLPGVTLLGAAVLGERVTLHSGVVVGSDGFGVAWGGDHWEKVPQLGSVRIGDEVEIGANTTVDRGALGDTVIEQGVKIDNQVQIAHNVFIGAHTAIAGCVGISGSARIGRCCRLAGGVGVVGHLEIADHVQVTGMSMVTRSITEPGIYSAGTPLMENRLWRRNAAAMKRLAGLAKRVDALERERGE